MKLNTFRGVVSRGRRRGSTATRSREQMQHRVTRVTSTVLPRVRARPDLVRVFFTASFDGSQSVRGTPAACASEGMGAHGRVRGDGAGPARGSPPAQATMYMLNRSSHPLRYEYNLVLRRVREICVLDATPHPSIARSTQPTRAVWPDHQKKSSHDDASTSNDHGDIWLRVEC